MPPHRPTAARNGKIPEILTYRYNKQMVYVTPAQSYEEGVQFAREVFPELAPLDPARIVISVNGLINQQRQLIRIGPMAWKTVVFSRAPFEVLDVTVAAPPAPAPVELDEPSAEGLEIVVTNPDGLPDYDSLKKLHPDEDFLAPSRAPSPPQSFVKPPRPFYDPKSEYSRSRSRSASPTPSTRSRDSSCSTLDWAKSLFGKRVSA